MTTILLIALTLMSEARGECSKGRQAVASVIWNRAHERKQSWDDICLAPRQFSYWDSHQPTEALAKEWQEEAPEVFEECMQLAESMVTYEFTPVVDANHFYNPRLASPYCKDRLTNVQIIGNHLFGKL